MTVKTAIAFLIGGLAVSLGACTPKAPAQTTIAPPAETLAEGFWWSEGPVWIGGADGYLLFTDVPQNKMFKWSEAGGLELYLEPSGAAVGEAEGFREPGANGLFPYDDNHILLADHGNRAVMLFDIAAKEKTVLADSYEGKKLNSPNDIVRRDDGVIFFTDPPYGLTDLDKSPLKEQPHNGVYRLAPDGQVTLIAPHLSKPNGIGLLSDGKTLIVANSDPAAAGWHWFELDENDAVIANASFDVTDQVGENNPGLPDGMVVIDDIIVATGPGGLYVLDERGYLGRVSIPRASANVTLGADGYIYVTSGNQLIRYKKEDVLALAEK